MAVGGLEFLRSDIAGHVAVRHLGHVVEAARGVLRVGGAGAHWQLGDRVQMSGVRGTGPGGEIVGLDTEFATVMCDGHADGVRIGDGVTHLGATAIAPDDSWLGRVIDPFGQPMDGRPLRRGGYWRDLRAAPPRATSRRRLGPRLETGSAIFNTLLPLVRGQRIGLFAGAGVGKSTLLARFARGVDADVTVIALIGERGRELREFIETVLGPEGMARTIIVAATSDQSPLSRRRCAWTAMAVAEHFRDQGRHVLMMADSVTRFAEAHREVALVAGEPPTLRGYPPSMSHLIMAWAERAGPGAEGTGDITAVFTVLVAGSDMDEPIADILRGVLDGHVVLEREIAERGRFPAINLLRSVSRSLPEAASLEENELIHRTRQLLGAYDRAEIMIQAGLYTKGTDPLIDAAVKVWSALDSFLAEEEIENISASYTRLRQILDQAEI